MNQIQILYEGELKLPESNKLLMCLLKMIFGFRAFVYDSIHCVSHKLTFRMVERKLEKETKKIPVKSFS